MNTHDRFERFLRNITLTANEREQATIRATTVAKKLHESFYPSRAYTGDTKLLIGSHGKRTRVRPVRDVDIMFKMPIEVFTQFNSHAGNGQSALLQAIRQVLLSRFPTTQIRGDGPVVCANFSTGHTVEVVPAFEATADKYLIPRTQNGGSWAVSSYLDEFNHLDKSDKATGQTRRLIKMIKIWQSAQKVPIKSLCIELRAINFLDKWEHTGKGAMWDDWMIRDFFLELTQHAASTCRIPGSDEVYSYGDKWLPKAQLAYSNATLAFRYESDKNDILADHCWVKIFGDQFVH